MKANINEIVGLIQVTDPKVLEKLQGQFPEYADLFQPGIILGEADETIDPTEILARGTICKAGLELVLKQCNEKLPMLKRRLKRLGNVQLTSQIIVGISGASLLTQPANANPAMNYAAGGLALLGSLLTIYSQHKSGTVLNSSQSIFSFYEKLVDNKLEAEQLLTDVGLALQVFEKSNQEKLPGIVAKGNQICMEIRKILEKL